jgi:hypothetical protein
MLSPRTVADETLAPWPQPSRPVGPKWPSRRRAPQRSTRRVRLLVFGLYLAVSLALTGWRWLADPTASCACQGTDPDAFMWMLAWWPFALSHAINPLFSHFVWYPVGVNVAKLTSIPALAIVVSPITELFGAQVSYNLITLASPALSAFTAYLLCRRICGREAPAVIGGFLFGFGAYEFPQLIGHPNLALVFVIPLMVLLALRRIDGEVTRRYYVLAMAALIFVQLGISSEVLTTAVMMGFAMLLVATVLSPRPIRRRIDGLVGETLVAGALAALIAAPFLYYALFQGGMPSETIGEGYGLDLLNPVFPTITTWLGGGAFHALTMRFEEGSFAESNGYLSLPIIVAFAWWAAKTDRRLLARLAVAGAVLAFVAALGAHLHVAGVETVPLPYALIKNLPVIRLLTPSRIAMYMSLAVAVGISAWLADGSAGRRQAASRWLVVGVGALMVFPSLGGQIWGAPPPAPKFFRTGLYHRYLESGEVALALPFAQNGSTTAWQAACGFCFAMPGAYLGHGAPSQVAGLPVINELGSNQSVNMELLRELAAADGIRDILVEAGPNTTQWTTEFQRYGLRGVAVGGVVVYHVPTQGLPTVPVSATTPTSPPALPLLVPAASSGAKPAA